MPTNVFLRTAKKRLSHSFHAFSWHRWPSCTFSFTKAPRCLKLLIPASNAIGRRGGHCSIVAGMPRWTETTDSCFTNCSTQNAFCSGVAIIALLRHRPREKRGVGLRMRTELEHLLFRSMWETYFCVRFESRNDRLKLLQSFWYTLYYRYTPCRCRYSLPIIFTMPNLKGWFLYSEDTAGSFSILPKVQIFEFHFFPVTFSRTKHGPIASLSQRTNPTCFLPSRDKKLMDNFPALFFFSLSSQLVFIMWWPF